jgi:hypothetical protein
MAKPYANYHLGSWSKDNAERIAAALNGKTSQKWHAYTFPNDGEFGVGVESWNCTKTELKDMLIYYLASGLVELNERT